MPEPQGATVGFIRPMFEELDTTCTCTRRRRGASCRMDKAAARWPEPFDWHDLDHPWEDEEWFTLEVP